MYTDNVLIFSTTRKEHRRHLTLVFEKYYGLMLNEDQRIFDVGEIVFLCPKVNREGVAPLESTVIVKESVTSLCFGKSLCEFFNR